MFTILLNCEDIGVLKIFAFAKAIISIIKIIVPIMLILSLMLDAFKNVTDKDGFNSKFVKKMATKIIAAVLVFFVMPITNIVLSLFQIDPIQEQECWKNANNDYISENENGASGNIDDPDLLTSNKAIEESLGKRKKLFKKKG